MTAWLVEPRDTLLVRDARPAGPGLSMRTLSFPWPSSMAGLARTRAGSDGSGLFTLDAQGAEALYDVPVKGPWLVELDATGHTRARAFPAPLDCTWYPACDDVTLPQADPPRPGDAALERIRLSPADLTDGALTDLPPGVRPLALATTPAQRKPSPHAPHFWRWRELRAWLLEPTDSLVQWRSLFGRPELLRERRLHVAIDAAVGTAEDGLLFATEGLRFADQNQQLAVAFQCADDRIQPGAVHLGGERRISWLRSDTGAALPERPAELISNPKQPPRHFRLVLLTPALFDDGWKPSRLPNATVYAAVVGRPQVVSGWKYATDRRGPRGPRASRRMAPAGSVYWVRLDDDVDDVTKWIDDHWMTCISDDAQDRRDGFGLCAIGVA